MELRPYIVIQKTVKTFETKKNVKITGREHSFKGFVSTYNVEILNSFNVELQLKDTESTIKNKPIDLLSKLRGFKFVAILVLVLKKIESEDKTKYDNYYSSSKSGTIFNESNKKDVFLLVHTTIISNIQKSLRKISGWIIRVPLVFQSIVP